MNSAEFVSKKMTYEHKSGYRKTGFIREGILCNTKKTLETYFMAKATTKIWKWFHWSELIRLNFEFKNLSIRN